MAVASKRPRSRPPGARVPGLAHAAGAVGALGRRRARHARQRRGISAIAADARWLAALGHTIISTHGIPDGVPFATAPTRGWHNVPVLAELVFAGLDSLAGARGLQLAQVAAVAIGCTLLAHDARRRGAGDRSTLVVLILVVPAAFAAIVAVRAQLFSLALFPLLALLLRAEARRPSRWIWAVPPLLALWSNLHGAALTGLAVAGAYLVVSRVRSEPLVAAGVLVASLLALCLTPALWHTPAYYASVVNGEAAKQGLGLWAPLSLTSALDLILLACLALAVWPIVRARPALWEIVALLGLAVLTVKTSRGGVWLVLFAVPLAASGLPWRSLRGARATVIALVACGLLTVAALLHGPIDTSASAALVQRAVLEARGTAVLADPQPGEQVELAGGKVWVANPIDAFSTADQRLWLDWLQGRPAGDAALRYAPRVVFVMRHSAAGERIARNPAFRLVQADARAAVYRPPLGAMARRRARATRSVRAAASRSAARRPRAPRARRARARPASRPARSPCPPATGRPRPRAQPGRRVRAGAAASGRPATRGRRRRASRRARALWGCRSSGRRAGTRARRPRRAATHRRRGRARARARTRRASRRDRGRARRGGAARARGRRTARPGRARAPTATSRATAGSTARATSWSSEASSAARSSSTSGRAPRKRRGRGRREQRGDLAGLAAALEQAGDDRLGGTGVACLDGRGDRGRRRRRARRRRSGCSGSAGKRAAPRPSSAATIDPAWASSSSRCAGAPPASAIASATAPPASPRPAPWLAA